MTLHTSLVRGRAVVHALAASVLASAVLADEEIALPIAFITDPGTDQVYRVRNWTGDFDYNDTDPFQETIVFYDDTLGTIPLTNPISITSSPDDFLYIGDTGEQLIVAMEDLNDDGDCHDAGEHFVYFNGDPNQNDSGIAMTNPNGVVTIELGQLWVANSNAGGSGSDGILHLTDLNMDGDTNDVGEAEMYLSIPETDPNDSIPTAVELGHEHHEEDGDEEVEVFYLENGSTGVYPKGVYLCEDLDENGVIDHATEVFPFFIPSVAGSLTALDVVREDDDHGDDHLWDDDDDDHGEEEPLVFFVVDHGLGHIWRISDENEDGMVDSTEAVIWWQASGSSDVMDIAVTEDAQVLATQALSPTRLHHFFDEDGSGVIDASNGEENDVYHEQQSLVDMAIPRGIDVDFHSHEEVGEHVCVGTDNLCPCDNSSANPEEGCQNSTGDGAILMGEGTTSVALDDLEFHATQLPPNQFAILFVGKETLNGGLGIPLHSGLYCIGGNSKRFGVVTIDAGGEAIWGPGLGVKGAWLAGESRVFQAVYRDAVGSSCQGFDVNFSSAVMIQFTQ